MQTARGQILSIRSDGAAATVTVNTVDFCARCASGKGCGAGVFGSSSGSRHFEAPISAAMDLCEGDEVQIELAPHNVLRAALQVYGAPLLGVLIMTGIAYLADLPDWQGAVAGGVGVLAGAAVSRYRLKRARCLRQFTPVITRRLAGTE
ncbi:MAG: hypothetical protein EX272_11000 [Chromatiales bacterium]|nr:MAG: hypothetical protein EX272_11000 [Chromatiales bacterium]